LVQKSKASLSFLSGSVKVRSRDREIRPIKADPQVTPIFLQRR
jgi:hypothetical protein